jgi:predicted phosphodiesterase
MLIHKADILLHGHLHDIESNVRSNADGSTLIVGVGTSYEKRETAQSFNIIEIDVNTGAGNVYFY